MKPLIGILVTIDNDKTTILKNTYSHAISKVGGTPIVLPYTQGEEDMERYVSLCDGFLFSGGKDVEPKRFNEDKINDSLVIHYYRDEFEFAMFQKIIKTDKPIMAICRGSQVINVALGGSLYQDIPTQIPSEINHRQVEGLKQYSHDVNVIKDTPLYRITNGCERIKANSFHHQSIKTLGKGLKLMATADDGIIEGAYLDSDRYLMLYQWHPEKIVDKNDFNTEIIKDFINHCK